MVNKIVLLIIGIVISISLATLAAADENNCVIESHHNYLSDTDDSWRIDMGDATHIRLHFSKWELAGDDRIYIYDSDHKIIARNSAGANGESYWSCDLYSTEYIEIRLVSRGGSAYGFCVDQVYTDNEAPPENYRRSSNYGNTDKRGAYKGSTSTEKPSPTTYDSECNGTSSTSSSQSGSSADSDQVPDQSGETSDSSNQVSTQTTDAIQSSTPDNAEQTSQVTETQSEITPQSQDAAYPNPDVTPTPTEVTTPVETVTPVAQETPVEQETPQETETDTGSHNKVAVMASSSSGSGDSHPSQAQLKWLEDQRKAAGKPIRTLTVTRAGTSSQQDDVALLNQANISEKQPDPTASISMHASQNDVQISQAIPIDLSVVSFHGEPARHCQIIIVVPDGLTVNCAELASYGAGQYGTTCSLAADEFKNVHIEATANHPGDYDMIGKVRFTVDDNPNSKEYHELTTHIHVYVPNVAPAPAWYDQSVDLTNKMTYVCYAVFGVLMIYIGILYVRGKLPI